MTALERFGLAYPRASAVVEMKFFGGMDTGEIAEVLNVPEKTVLGDWSFARIWLSRVLMQRARNQGERVARLFTSISECSEKEPAEFVRTTTAELIWIFRRRRIDPCAL